MGFDARAAKGLAAGEHIIVDDAPGLRLVATATRKTWTYRYKSPVDARMKQVAIGQWPAVSYAAALGLWDVLRQRRNAGEDVAQEKKRAIAVTRAAAAQKKGGGAYTVRRLISDYLDGPIKRRKLNGQKEARRLMLEGGYTDSLLSMLPQAVKRADAFTVLETLGARAPVLAGTLRTELGAAWDYALDAGRIPEETPNWWRQIMRGKLKSRGKIVHGVHEGKRKYRVLHDDEVKVLLAWLPNFPRLQRDLIEHYLWSGCRGAEIVAMRGDEVTIEPDGWWWTIPREKLKMERLETAHDLRVPLIGRLLSIVKRRMELYGNGFLYQPIRPNAINPHVEQKVLGVALWIVRPTTVTKDLPKDRVKVLHIKSFAPHDLRRTVRTKLSALGCESKVAEAVLGHFGTGEEGVYDRHNYDAERRHWLTQIDAHWEKLARS
ncbi:integrase family protein [Comamonadaceae bacterium PP-2]